MHTPPTTDTKPVQGTKQQPFFSGGAMPFFQPKLTVNEPGDAHEQEADRVADQVMRMREGDAPVVQRMPITPVSSVQSKCTECKKEDKAQRKETGGGNTSGQSAPTIVRDVLSAGGGRQMDTATKGFMESRFGQDFGQVRIHTDTRAAESASAIQAKAYTSGSNIVFGQGEYQPSSEGGQRLLAHELVHYVQREAGVQSKAKAGVLQNTISDRTNNEIISNSLSDVVQRVTKLTNTERESVVSNAKGEISKNVRFGKSVPKNDESGIDRIEEYRGMAAPTYNLDQMRQISWCGIFALWAYKKAGIKVGNWKPNNGIGSVDNIKIEPIPQKGDIGYLDYPLQHHLIIEEIDSNTVKSIDGNSNGGQILQKSRPRSAFKPTIEVPEDNKKPDGPKKTINVNNGFLSFQIQPKLTANTRGDAHEQESDRVADQVMRMREGDEPIVQRMPITPLGAVQRKCAECEKEEQKGAAQRKELGGTDASGKAAPTIVSNVLSTGGGRQMDTATKGFMESRFGQDFSDVRIHTDSRAAESASAIQARAYTSGKDIVFGQGEYQPSSDSGRRLLAHELVHVGQQGANTVQKKQDIVQRQQVANSRVAEYDTPQTRGGMGRRATLPQSATNNIELIRYLCNCESSDVTRDDLSGRLQPNPGFTYQYCRGNVTARVDGDIIPQTLTSGTAQIGGGINIAPGNGSPGFAAGLGLQASNTGNEPTVGAQSRVSIGDENTSLDVGAGFTHGTRTGNNQLDAGIGLNIGGMRFGVSATDLLNPGRGFGLSIGPAQTGPARDTCRTCHCPIIYKCYDDMPPRTYEEEVPVTYNEQTPLRYYFQVGTTRDTLNEKLLQMSKDMLSRVKGRVEAGARIVSIIGYASPEWRSQNTGDGGRKNEELSNNRARRLRQLLQGVGLTEAQLPHFDSEEARSRSETGGELMGNRPSHWRSDSQLSEAIFESGFGPEEFDLFLFGDDIPDGDLNRQFLGLLDRIVEPNRRLQLFGIARNDPAAAPLLSHLEDFVRFRGNRGPVWRNIFEYLRFATVTLTETKHSTRTETRSTTGSIEELSQERCRPYAQQAERAGLLGPVAPTPVSDRACQSQNGNNPDTNAVCRN